MTTPPVGEPPRAGAPSVGGAPGVVLVLPSGQRLCGYSRCRLELPVEEGRGRKQEFCPDREHVAPDGTRSTCKELARSERLLHAHHGHQAVTGGDVAQLGAHVEALLPALAPVQTAVTAAVGILDLVRGQLRDEVEAAFTTRAEALAQAAEHDGLRAAAVRRAEEAEEQAGDATREAAEDRRLREAADRRRTEALDAERKAQEDKRVAEARSALLKAALDRAVHTVRSANDRARLTGERLAEANAVIAALRERVEQETGRADTAAALVNTTLAQAAEARGALEREWQGKLDTLRGEIDQRLAERDEAVRAQVTAQAEEARRTLAGEHAAVMAAKDRELGGLNQQLGEVRGTARGAVERYDRLWRAVNDLVIEPGAEPDADAEAAAVAELPARLRTLLATHPTAEGEPGVED